MQMDELFEFVYILLDKKQVTAKEMAERFGVSIRTIYRWVESLSASGIPLYAVKGRGGGIAISERYALDKTVLTEEERQAIVASVKALNTLSGNAGSARDTQHTAAEKLSRLSAHETDWIEVDFAPWSPEGQGVRERFGMLRDCILKKRQVAFDYFSVSGTYERRTVHPMKLVYRGQAWYLYGWCTARKAGRYFKLSRMLNVTRTGRAASLPPPAESKAPADTKTPAASKTAAAPKQPAEPKPSAVKPAEGAAPKPFIQVTVQVSAKLAYLFLDTFACTDVKAHENGSITAVFSAPDEAWLAGRLLGFGADLRIISPDPLRRAVQQLAQDVLSLYAQDRQD